MVIGIAGPTASGKTSVAKMLAHTYGAQCIRYSSILSEMAREHFLDPTDKATLQNLYLDERTRRGEDFLAKELRTRVAGMDAPHIVVEGNRRLVDVEALRNIAADRAEPLVLLFIDASVEARFQRYNERRISLGAPPITFDEFMELEQNTAEDEVQDLRTIFRDEGIYIDTDSLTESETAEQVARALGLDEDASPVIHV